MTEPTEETRAEREERLRQEAQEQSDVERAAMKQMLGGMAQRYGPLVELLQSASTYIGNMLVDAKRAERYSDLNKIEYLIRRDSSEALGVAIAMAMGVEMKRRGQEPSPIRDKAATILNADGSTLR